MMQRYENIIKSNLFELCRAIAKSTKSKAEYLMRVALPSATLDPTAERGGGMISVRSSKSASERKSTYSLGTTNEHRA